MGEASCAAVDGGYGCLARREGEIKDLQHRQITIGSSYTAFSRLMICGLMMMVSRHLMRDAIDAGLQRHSSVSGSV